MRSVMSAALASLLLGVTSITQAHHSGSIYDEKHPLALDGSITQLEWVNPHVLIHFIVTSPDGKMTLWTAETNVPSALQSMGLTKRRMEAALGTKVKIYVSPARDGTPLGFFNGIDFADGTKFRVRGTPAAAAAAAPSGSH